MNMEAFRKKLDELEESLMAYHLKKDEAGPPSVIIVGICGPLSLSFADELMKAFHTRQIRFVTGSIAQIQLEADKLRESVRHCESMYPALNKDLLIRDIRELAKEPPALVTHKPYQQRGYKAAPGSRADRYSRPRNNS